MLCVCFSVPPVLFIDLVMLLRSCLAGVCIFSGQKYINPLPFSVSHSIQFINSLERCFVVVGLIVLLFFYLTLLNDFERIRF